MGQQEELAVLAARVARIEALLRERGIDWPEVDPKPTAVPPPLPVAPPAAVSPPPYVPTDERGVPIAFAETREPQPSPTLGDEALAPPPVPAAISLEEKLYHYERLVNPYGNALNAAPPVSSAEVEQTIGLKVAGWIGAIVLVIGAALGVKFAYDQGWLGRLPNELRLGLLYALGVAIIGVGEWVYRKVDRCAAVGPYAAGVACLFVVGYAGSAYFKLYTPATSFFLMAAACLVGGAIALRAGLVSIAILSLLGANIAPLILRDRSVGEVPLLIYLLALQVMAVGIAYLGGLKARWWILRTFVLVTTSLWMLGRLVDSGTAHSTLTILFAAIYFLVFQIENALAARRSGQATSDASPFSFPSFSLIVTAIFTTQMLVWGSTYTPTQQCIMVLSLGAIALVAGIAAQPAANPAVRSLGLGWILQAGLLSVVAVPVALSGPWLTLGWALLALGFAILGSALRRPRTVIGAAMIWFASVGHLFFVGALLQTPELRAVWLSIADITIPAYLVIAAIIGAIGQVLAIVMARVDRQPDEVAQRTIGPATVSRDVSGFVAVIATVVIAIASVVALPPLWATGVGIALAWLHVGLMRFSQRGLHGSIAFVVAGLALAKWAAVDVLHARLAPSWQADAQTLVFNPTIGVGLLAAVTLCAIARLARPQADQDRSQLRIILAAAVFAMTIGLSIEVQRAVTMFGSPVWPALQLTQFGWTILWLAAVLLQKPIGDWLDPSSARMPLSRQAIGVGVLALAGKFLLIDSLAFAIDAPRATSPTPIANMHLLTAGIVLASVGWALSWNRKTVLATALGMAIFLVPLVSISMELNRIVGPDRTQVALSVFWGIYAIGSIVVGFVFRLAACRFAGLGLLGVTLFKIVLVDLAHAGAGWRILSFLGVGAILLTTSVLYGKLSPKLLDQASREE